MCALLLFAWLVVPAPHRFQSSSRSLWMQCKARNTPLVNRVTLGVQTKRHIPHADNGATHTRTHSIVTPWKVARCAKKTNPVRKPIEALPTCRDFDCNCIFICICICIYNRYGTRGVSAYVSVSVSVSICPINSQAKAKLAKLHARTYAYIYIHVYTNISLSLSPFL